MAKKNLGHFAGKPFTGILSARESALQWALRSDSPLLRPWIGSECEKQGSDPSSSIDRNFPEREFPRSLCILANSPGAEQ